MAKGKSIPEAIRWVIIRLSTAMTTEEISMYTDVSERSVRKILSYFNQTGDVEGKKETKPLLYKSLCDYDIEVWY
jgi:transcription initiation factor IIE alpha subunit